MLLGNYQVRCYAKINNVTKCFICYFFSYSCYRRKRSSDSEQRRISAKLRLITSSPISTGLT